jgi:alpha-galactosidase
MSAKEISRREILSLALAAPLLRLMPQPIGRRLSRQVFISAPNRVVPLDSAQDIRGIEIIRKWTGPLCRSRLINHGHEKVRIKEAILFDLKLTLPAETSLYGEGFQMLSQNGGTLGQPTDLGNYTDAKHYRIPAPRGTRAFYGMMTLATDDANDLLGFTSCRRFIGQFYLQGASLKVVVDTEGLEIKPGETWELEEFMFDSAPARATVLDSLAGRINVNHPPLSFPKPPMGWCSWYCFGPRVTAQQVLDNLDFISKNTPGLKYIQIDDGYQPAMGDWLETGAAFGGNVQGVLKQIRAGGFEPAIWVAPFIAEEKSNLFQQHPDWFMQDADRKPLAADRVTFGGWRRGPWYALDGTNPDVQKHLESVFRTMRRDWGVTYFKLDANFWGAMHSGRLHDRNATRIEAYRRGMQAVLRGAGDSFILGCNHPIWPSFGLIHGSRSSNDIKRSWDRFVTTARQNLSRNWQNGRLWWNDPDVVVLTGDLTEDEFRFHATAIYATGGMLLSGDDLTKISAEKLAMLRKLQPPSGVAARFDDESLQIGRVRLRDREVIAALNWSDEIKTISFRLREKNKVKDFWSGESLGQHEEKFIIESMPKHSARLLICS